MLLLLQLLPAATVAALLLNNAVVRRYSFDCLANSHPKSIPLSCSRRCHCSWPLSMRYGARHNNGVSSLRESWFGGLRWKRSPRDGRHALTQTRLKWRRKGPIRKIRGTFLSP